MTLRADETKVESIICSKTGSSLAHYPHAKRVGNMLFLSGISARQPDNSVMGVVHKSDGTVVTSIILQTKGVIENINNVLEEAGGKLENIVDMSVFLVNMADYAEFNEVYNSYFDAVTGPSRTTVGVSSLPGPHLLIEVKAIAFLPSQ